MFMVYLGHGRRDCFTGGGFIKYHMVFWLICCRETVKDETSDLIAAHKGGAF